MARVIAGMTMSVDGFVADRSGSAAPLYEDLTALRGTPYMEESIRETGAVVMGRTAFEMGEPDSYAGNYEYQVPIFVLSHQVPDVRPRGQGNLAFTFVTDGVESAIRQARAAAGDRDVTVVGGPSTIRQLLDAGLVDELRVDVLPVLLGEGLRLFEDNPSGPVQLDKVATTDVGQRTSLRFRVTPPE
jgi:dihydrofolate reductase